MSIKVKTSNNKIKIDLLRIFKNEMYKRALEVIPAIKIEIRQKTLEIWQQSPTYESLIGGDLNHQLGFPQGTAKSTVDTVLRQLSNSIFIKAKKSTRGLITIGVFQKNVVVSPFEEIPIQQDDPEKLDELDWFHWLTLFGNKYIIWQYEYVDEVTPRSRSGRGIMKYSEDSPGWRIPAEHAGTIDNNWLTRALNENSYVQSSYAEIISKYFYGD